MPDFDVDFCQDRRDEVIAHVQEKYGANRVAQIITFGKLQARAALRDVGRVLGMPYGQVDRISKMVPYNPAHPPTLAEALEAEPRLKEMRDQDETVAKLIDIAMKLEGLYRHASTHAAGVVIGDRPLEELLPLYRDPRSPLIATQFSMKYTEAAGLVKFDFLGLKTLTVLTRAVELLRAPRHRSRSARPPARRQGDLRHAGPRRDDGGVPAGKRGHARRAAPDASRQVRGHHRAGRALPPRPDGQHPEIHRREGGQRGARLPASRAGADPDGDVRGHDLSGAGDADRAEAFGLLARQGGSAAPRHGQEDQGGDGGAAPVLRRGRGRARRRRQAGGDDLRAGRQVRRLRLQQIARRGLRADCLADGMAEGEPPGRVLRRDPDLRHGQHRQAQFVPPGIDARRHQAVAARHQPIRGRFRGGGRRDPLCARRREERRRPGDAHARRRAHGERGVRRSWRFLSRGWIRASPTSDSSKT